MEMLCLESSSGFCQKARDIYAPFVPQRLSNVPHLRKKKKQKFRKDKAIPENRHFSAVERRTILNVIIIVIWVDSLSWKLVSHPFLRNWMEMNPLEELNYGWETIEKEYSIFC